MAPRWVWGAALLALLAACRGADNSTHGEGAVAGGAEGADGADGADGAEAAALAGSVNDFSFRLLQQMQRAEGGNAVLSAAGVVGVLGMAMMGSVGATYSELARALGFPQDILASGAAHAALGALLGAGAGGAGAARAVAAGRRARLRAGYRALLARLYHADVLDVDFEELQNTMDLINGWVSAASGGGVARLLRAPPPPGTRLLLLSAHHFRAAWQAPFAAEHTRRMPFETETGNVTAELMLNIGKFDYVYSEQCQCHMVALPYRGGAGALYALMPRPSRRPPPAAAAAAVAPAAPAGPLAALTALLERLGWAGIEQLRLNMTRQDVVIRFPKMELNSEGNLRAPLQALGVSALFDPARANLALALQGAAPAPAPCAPPAACPAPAAVGGVQLHAPPAHIDAVLHQANMKFDEWGTRAAGAAGGVQARSAALFVTGAPFLLFVRDARSRLVTFSAVVAAPPPPPPTGPPSTLPS